MRREEIVSGCIALAKAISDSHIGEVLIDAFDKMQHGNERGRNTSIQILTALQAYSIRASQFDKTTLNLVKIFELSALQDPKIWSSLAAEDARENISLFWELNNRIKFATKNMPKILSILETEATRLENSLAARYPDKSTIKIYVTEDERHISSVRRVIMALQAVASLYDAFAALNKETETTLAIIGCDSGSDKSFDLLGAAKVIEGIKGVILSLWDKVFFFREHQFAKRLELATQSLPILDNLKNLESQGKLGPEEAELIRRGIVNGVTSFLQSGCIIKEIEIRAHSVAPRELMAPEPKLLTAGIEIPEEKQPSKTISYDSTELSVDKTITDEDEDEDEIDDKPQRHIISRRSRRKE